MRPSRALFQAAEGRGPAAATGRPESGRAAGDGLLKIYKLVGRRQRTVVEAVRTGRFVWPGATGGRQRGGVGGFSPRSFQKRAGEQPCRLRHGGGGRGRVSSGNGHGLSLGLMVWRFGEDFVVKKLQLVNIFLLYYFSIC
jgi:hypothetical protein